MDLNALLSRAVDAGASDIHLKLGRPPVVRRDGALVPLEDMPPLAMSDLETVLHTVAAAVPEKARAFRESGDLDLAYQADGLPRFRVNVFLARGAAAFAFRVIPALVPSFEQLGLPPGVEALASEQRGLILVTGATGSGKTTTLASMVDYINRTRRQHVVAIEDPIEILHADKGCIVSQREVGLDTVSFTEALRRAMRQDPDVILIGELRDAESAQIALQAAESGHLVLSTLHTIDAAETCGRMIEFFPPEKQGVIRAILAGVLRGVVSQRLLPRVGGGRVVAVELMVMNARIADLIREGRTEEIGDAVAEGDFLQMQTFADSLIDLVLSGQVERELAAGAASNRHDFVVALERAVKQRHADAASAAAQPPPAPEPAAEHESGLRLIPAE